MPTPEIDIEHLRQWIGRSDQNEDRLEPGHARAVAATLNHAQPPRTGDLLPPLWHWTFFRPAPAARDLGPDGHAKRDGFLPPIPLPRRMWVGGEVQFLTPLRVGMAVTRKTTISDVTAKVGRGGALVFLTLAHDIHSAGALLIRETQNIVYREAAAAAPVAQRVVQADPVPERGPADWRERIVPDPTLLFRYSALTFNTHRIHYDRDYARSAEGYRGLVVHGPLTATLLMDRLVAHKGPAVRRFAFRARQPLFCNEPMALCGSDVGATGFELWAETPDGEIAMSAEASY